MALTDKLKAIADAIRAKTGGSAKLTLTQMPAAIAGISGGSGGSGLRQYQAAALGEDGVVFFDLPDGLGRDAATFESYAMFAILRVYMASVTLNLTCYYEDIVDDVSFDAQYISASGGIDFGPEIVCVEDNQLVWNYGGSNPFNCDCELFVYYYPPDER